MTGSSASSPPDLPNFGSLLIKSATALMLSDVLESTEKLICTPAPSAPSMMRNDAPRTMSMADAEPVGVVTRGGPTACHIVSMACSAASVWRAASPAVAGTPCAEIHVLSNVMLPGSRRRTHSE